MNPPFEDEFAGTSAAAPNVCASIAKALAEIRRAVGASHEGPESSALVRAGGDLPSRGPLRDGILSNCEFERVIHTTADPGAFSPPDPQRDPFAVPAPPVAPFLREGYGIVDYRSARRAVAVALGLSPRPRRDLEDRWFEVTEQIRILQWGDSPSCA